MQTMTDPCLVQTKLIPLFVVQSHFAQTNRLITMLGNEMRFFRRSRDWTCLICLMLRRAYNDARLLTMCRELWFCVRIINLNATAAFEHICFTVALIQLSAVSELLGGH